MKLCFVVAYKTAKKNNVNVKIRTNVLARNARRYGVIRDTAKSLENIPRCTSIYP